MPHNNTYVDNDINRLNFQFLMIARECARQDPLGAIWKFNMNNDEIEKISSMSLNDLESIAACNRAIFTLLPITTMPQRTGKNVTPSIMAALLTNKSSPIA